MELYHVINRGVAGQDLFLDTQDYARFVHDLYEFNDTAPAQQYSRASLRSTTGNVGRTTSNIREKIIDVHGWILMKDHYHLILSERVEGGISLFLRKLSGYARYFNDRHHRRGTLLQGRTRKILVEHHRHFLYLLHYVHLNALDYLPGATNWRERDKGTLPNTRVILDHLNHYRWSSYLDYMGTKNFPSVLTKSLFQPSLDESYSAALLEYIQDRESQTVDSLHLE